MLDDEVHTGEDHVQSPETALLQSADAELLRNTLEKLPGEFREVLVLRELEGMSYREIAGYTSGHRNVSSGTRPRRSPTTIDRSGEEGALM